eukprot:CAMPEP_0118649452 /NCGR_PEP_ID=MMETSP0785-20121206/9711_1 /TAXON_ID=91992 /ORGANISM="Bolidomonas pacifica, Strain CCMP 1866" /LENGTH=502 /DNA_ID=CAMNT_0006541741 /DNA_START=125 /DNA_END=1630 /DNA_ORIENTATION=+
MDNIELHSLSKDSAYSLPSVPTPTSVPNPTSAPFTGISISPTPQKDAKSSIPSAISNFLNSIVGAGIIGIPFAIRHCGLFMGIILLTWVGYLTDCSVRMIVTLGRDLGVNDYERLAEKIYGPRGYNAICVFMIFLAFGAMVAYCIVVGDVVPELLGVTSSPAARPVSILLCSMFVMLPLSLLKDMSSLAKTSTLSCAADMVLVLIVMACTPIGVSIADAGGFWKVLGSSIVRPKTVFSGLGAMSFAFVCHHSSFIVANSLKDSTKERWATVTHWSVSMAYTMCLFMGLFGYLGFLEETKGNVLVNFEGGDDLGALSAGRVMLVLTMFFTYPMESFVARHALISVVYGKEAAHEDNPRRRYKVTIGLYVAALVLSLFLPDLGIVLELTGAVSGSFLSYILPSSMYMCVHEKELLSLLKQLRLDQGILFFCCRKVIDSSELNEEDVTTRERDSSIDASDTPIEIGGCQDLVGNGSFFSRTRNTINALRPFWLVLSMFSFGVVAF